MTHYIIGADEVGCGSFAGPLVSCALAVTHDWIPPHGLNDSKKLTPEAREYVYGALHRLPLHLSCVSSETIDRIGLGKSIVLAHTEAIRAVLSSYPDAEVILDGNVRLPELPNVRSVPKADSKYPAVMAASIVAKVNHDRLMVEYARQYPGYDFESNMGYNSPRHVEGLDRLGPCPIHRRSYAPIRKRLEMKL